MEVLRSTNPGDGLDAGQHRADPLSTMIGRPHTVWVWCLNGSGTLHGSQRQPLNRPGTRDFCRLVVQLGDTQAETDQRRSVQVNRVPHRRVHSTQREWLLRQTVEGLYTPYGSTGHEPSADQQVKCTKFGGSLPGW